MDEIASLQIRVDGDQALASARQLALLEQAAQRAENEVIDLEQAARASSNTFRNYSRNISSTQNTADQFVRVLRQNESGLINLQDATFSLIRTNNQASSAFRNSSTSANNLNREFDNLSSNQIARTFTNISQNVEELERSIRSLAAVTARLDTGVRDLNRFGAELGDLRGDLRRVDSAADGARDSVGGFVSVASRGQFGSVGLTTGLNGLALAFTAAGAAATGMMAITSNQARELETLARIAGLSVEDLQSLSFATNTVTINMEQFADISKDARERVGDFITTGAGPLIDFFEQVAPKIGITAEQLKGLSGPEVLIAVKSAMDAANLSMEEQSFHLESIASDSTKLAPLLANNGAEMLRLANRANELNGVLSDVEVAELKEVSIVIDELQTAFGGLTNRLALELAPAFTNVANSITSVFVDANRALASGQVTTILNAYVLQFQQLGNIVGSTFDFIKNTIINSFEASGKEGDKYFEQVRVALLNLPATVALVVENAAGSFRSFFLKVGANVAAMVENVKRNFNLIKDIAGVIASEISDTLNVFDGNSFDFSSNLQKVLNDSQQKEIANTDKLQKRLQEIEYERAKGLVNSTNTYQKLIEVQENSLHVANLQREAYEKSFKAGAKLPEFNIPEFSGANSAIDPRVVKEGAALAKQRENQLKSQYEALERSLLSERELIGREEREKLSILTTYQGISEEQRAELSDKVRKIAEDARNKELVGLQESLKTEEQTLIDSYNRRLDIVLNNTQEGSEKRFDLIRRLEEDFQQSVLDGFSEENPQDDLASELQKLQESFDAKRTLILDNERLTEETRTSLLEKLNNARLSKLEALETERRNLLYTGSAELFSNLGGLTKQFAGEQSGIYKAMFAASKAFAIADSVVKIQQGIASAASTPFPANLGAIGSVVAATSGILSTINDTKLNFAGAFDKGGRIGAGEYGLVGELGPELIQGPVNVTGREETAKMFKEKPESSTILNVMIQNNVSGIDFEVEQLSPTDVRIIAREEAKRVVSQDIDGLVAGSIARPNSRTSKALQTNTTVSRRRAS